jgi:hypothetical protein
MNSLLSRRLFVFGLACLAVAFVAPRSHAHTTQEAMAEAATRFLNALDADQRKAAQFDFANAERKNWNFVPMERAGLPLKKMKPAQQHLAIALLQSALSHRGMNKALNIMALEQVLFEMENGAPKRDPALYHFYIFGTPSNSEDWGWRVEGHHFSMSITIVDGKIVAKTPLFLGANPARVKQGPHAGLRVLHAEEDLARELLGQLDEAQRKQAVLMTEIPADIINGPSRKTAEALEPKGLSAGQMNDSQRRSLMRIVGEYVRTYRPDLAKRDLQEIRDAGVQQLHFAWIGSDQPGQPHYYRIQGPTFILEYDNTQNDANHVHVAWRDFQGDFGDDVLREHYEKQPHREAEPVGAAQ